jgi:hypothetical protein
MPSLRKSGALMPLAAKRVLVLVGKVLKQHGLQVTPTADH